LTDEPMLPAKSSERTGWLQQIDTIGGRLPSAWEPEGLAGAYQVAALISTSGLAPKGLEGKPADIMLVLWTGRELGLSAMASMAQLHPINGRVTQAAELMRARCLRSPECLRFDVIEASDKSATVEVLRKGGEPRRVTFTIEQAKAAGLFEGRGGETWKRYPEDKLVARATSRAARRYFPDLLGPAGYTPDEILEAPEERNITPASEAAQQAAQTIVAAAQPRHKLTGEMMPDGRVVVDLPEGPIIMHERKMAPRAETMNAEEVRHAEELAAKARAAREPRPWQHLLDMKIPRVGDKAAAAMQAAGINSAEEICAAGASRLEGLDGIGKLGAQAIVLWAEKQLEPAEPERTATAMTPEQEYAAPDQEQPVRHYAATIEESVATGRPLMTVAQALADPAGFVANMEEIPFPGQEKDRAVKVAEQRQALAEPQLPPPPPKPPAGALRASQGSPIRSHEVYGLIMQANRTKTGGEKMLRQWVADTFEVAQLEQLPNNLYGAVFEWAAAEGDNPPESTRLAELRQRGMAR
jgi:hypothetical protein